MFERLKEKYRKHQCSKERHVWETYTVNANKMYYYCRRCIHCLQHEIENAGPSGNQKWQLVSTPFRWEWERKNFEEAVRNYNERIPQNPNCVQAESSQE